MSTPLPVTEKVVAVALALPARAGLPTSCAVHGAGSDDGVTTVNEALLLARPPTVTTTLPVVAPAGTGTPMLVAVHVAGAPVMPLKVMVLVPLVAPKFVPAGVTAAPSGPLAGARFVAVGAPPTPVTVQVNVWLCLRKP